MVTIEPKADSTYTFEMERAVSAVIIFRRYDRQYIPSLSAQLSRRLRLIKTDRLSCTLATNVVRLQLRGLRYDLGNFGQTLTTSLPYPDPSRRPDASA
jgi:hypothetical protein